MVEKWRPGYMGRVQVFWVEIKYEGKETFRSQMLGYSRQNRERYLLAAGVDEKFVGMAWRTQLPGS